ncbi:MAG: acetyl-CoA carboxylase biotin carboxyl carrier protein subunit [Candidatus Cloacimonetes bacterium]|nr:acetyl-CoA carboxylase biotin carboxyl carrier protein subunit [Candidatus Cloacimonadota bacterium]MBS3767454.1 acetyl-CoA carboxylase biotin carboxyl carrier protein subunit [Candidatus Cloacimonadota bacterium]
MKTYKMEINGKKFEGKVIEYDGLNVKIEINGITYQVEMEPEFGKSKEQVKRPKKVITNPPTLSGESPTNSSEREQNISKVLAPLPGVILDIEVEVGDEVKAGDVVLLLEAMKMESEITTPVDGIVKKINTKEGETVEEAKNLMEIEVK